LLKCYTAVKLLVLMQPRGRACFVAESPRGRLPAAVRRSGGDDLLRLAGR
jgi:hypothetical protein